MERLDYLLNKRPRIFYNKFSADVETIEVGIIFMYTPWAITHVQLIGLIASLEEFPDIDLFVFNTTDSEFVGYCEKTNLHSEAWGETFWVKSGKVVAQEKKYDLNVEPGIIEKLIANNRSISAFTNFTR